MRARSAPIPTSPQRGEVKSECFKLIEICPNWIVAGMLMTGLVMAQAQPQTADPPRQELPSADIVPDRPASSGPVAPADPSVQSGAGLPACLIWSDSCVTCERADGKISCSNIGIACQPQAPRCLRAEDK
jgi:hypothetical protein